MDIPEGILCDGDPQELAQVVQHPHGGCAGPALQEGRNHVEQHKGVEHLQGSTLHHSPSVLSTVCCS